MNVTLATHLAPLQPDSFSNHVVTNMYPTEEQGLFLCYFFCHHNSCPLLLLAVVPPVILSSDPGAEQDRDDGTIFEDRVYERASGFS